jgi:hypothetical protein
MRQVNHFRSRRRVAGYLFDLFSFNHNHHILSNCIAPPIKKTSTPHGDNSGRSGLPVEQINECTEENDKPASNPSHTSSSTEN